MSPQTWSLDWISLSVSKPSPAARSLIHLDRIRIAHLTGRVHLLNELFLESHISSNLFCLHFNHFTEIQEVDFPPKSKVSFISVSFCNLKKSSKSTSSQFPLFHPHLLHFTSLGCSTLLTIGKFSSTIPFFEPFVTCLKATWTAQVWQQ